MLIKYDGLASILFYAGLSWHVLPDVNLSFIWIFFVSQWVGRNRHKQWVSRIYISTVISLLTALLIVDTDSHLNHWIFFKTKSSRNLSWVFFAVKLCLYLTRELLNDGFMANLSLPISISETHIKMDDKRFYDRYVCCKIVSRFKEVKRMITLSNLTEIRRMAWVVKTFSFLV